MHSSPCHNHSHWHRIWAKTQSCLRDHIHRPTLELFCHPAKTKCRTRDVVSASDNKIHTWTWIEIHNTNSCNLVQWNGKCIQPKWWKTSTIHQTIIWDYLRLTRKTKQRIHLYRSCIVDRYAIIEKAFCDFYRTALRGRQPKSAAKFILWRIDWMK